ncbi:serine/threonine-protein kinase [Microtetraspora sp. AC03309]|uniref:serine/threonine-protein kinase n=1 Tax=Microtetraspora sp. AC03309 TaxID=2779376 RepID=UPI001E329070|nr:serine/threonine-protein kinase [Microtetraspora sp. AC03309]
MGEAGMPLLPGYETLGVLGQGGFGVVYRARQLAVGREVALKLDNRVLLSDRDRRRFLREVTSAGALSGHPHVADVYDAGVLPDGRPYMVLELCPGGSLADRVKAYGPLGAAEVRDIGIKIADALAAAHSAGVLHRDVKPANILINSYGLVALSDFGLATMPGKGGGEHASVTLESLTPAFAPPEAFDLTEPTAAGDVYALSATLYALLRGRPPRFPEGGVVNVAAILALHRLPIPEIPGVPPALVGVLRDGMASDPRERIGSAAELRDALSRLRPDGASHEESGRQPGPESHAWPRVEPRTNGAAGRVERAPDAAGGTPGRFPGTTGGARDPHVTAGGAGPYQVVSPHSALATLPPEPRTHRRSAVYATMAAVFATLLVLGIVLLAPWNPDGVGVDAHPGSTGSTGSAVPSTPGTGTTGPAATADGGRNGIEVATYTAGCPAAEVASASAACVTDPECWAGTVSIAGDVTARSVPCAKPHAWETFAIAPLPPGVTTDEDTVASHPTVTLLCSKYVLLLSRRGASAKIPANKWQVTVLPPSAAKYAAGMRSYRCLGRLYGNDTSGSRFARST